MDLGSRYISRLSSTSHREISLIMLMVIEISILLT